MRHAEIKVYDRKYTLYEDGTLVNSYGREIHAREDHVGGGYPRFTLSKKGHKRVRLLQHRLVAEAFTPNPDNLPEVNHKNGNTRDCSIDNLEWVTASENQTHSRYTLRNETGFSDTPVMCVETGKVYRSTRDAWRDTGAGYSHISECARGKRKTAGGFHWRSVE